MALLEPIRLKVPRADNTLLVWPEASTETLAEESMRVRRSYPEWMQQLQRTSRREVLQHLEGSTFTCSCHMGDGKVLLSDAVWLVGGHQPELFHPGVWFKNFFLSSIKKSWEHHSPAPFSLNVVIDHDLAKSGSLRSNYMAEGRLFQRSQPIPIYRVGDSTVPWELTRFRSEDTSAWERWIDNLTADCETLGIEPIVETRRSLLLELLRTSENVGQAFAEFRRQIEREHGVANAEIAMSEICSTSAFGEFLYRCLNSRADLVACYNQARNDFRVSRRIRNPVQPVPELQLEGEWCELPFWIYFNENRVRERIERDQDGGVGDGKSGSGENIEPKRNSLRREKLWGKKTKDGWWLASQPRDDADHRLWMSHELSRWHTEWLLSIDQGVCIRPRALTNTLFLRYILADLFVHGIGGGVYDAVTDRIAHLLWGIEPIPMAVVSASLHLPLSLHRDSRTPDHRKESSELERPILGSGMPTEPLIRERPEIERDLHRLRSSPEWFLDPDVPQQAALLHSHEALLRNRPPRGLRREWHRQMSELRARVRQSVYGAAQELERESEILMERERQLRIATSRETSFVLFPESNIAGRLERLIPGSGVLTSADNTESQNGVRF